ncbi:ABC transporter ATP-binding protein [Pseudonocardia kujensis]|uniref:ABC transporter ATP-binding protein n=1 Tax=Pseudonocardia kujensis TaxID=1128675 RepID=UPI001E52C164|nr:ABC transporter ATP-binding protein [Pseudonocardia kujensis]MCE0768085.1 ABC transporter ATP-binding protein [Pseudonocardia kujensis]
MSKSFGKLAAVSDVSLDVARGEVFGLAGPNGAGKTTLFNVLTGIPFGPDSGEVLLDGRDLARRPGWYIARAGLARTFQTEAVFDDLSVLDNVRLCASRSALGAGRRRDRPSAEETAREALATVGIRDPYAGAGSLSLVDRKRLMIATAIVGRPRVLLLDEPAAGLEPQDQDDLVDLLTRINTDGTTLLLVEHVLRVLRELSDRMAVLDAGRVLTVGEPEAVLSDPRVVQAYLGPGEH